MGGPGAAGGGRRWAVRDGRGPAAVVAAHSGAPAMKDEQGQAGKLQRDERNPFRDLAWVGDGRRWGRGGEQELRAAMAGGAWLCKAGEAGALGGQHWTALPRPVTAVAVASSAGAAAAQIERRQAAMMRAQAGSGAAMAFARAELGSGREREWRGKKRVGFADR